MIKLMQKILKEPLLHFFILGLVIYVVYDSKTSQAVQQPQRQMSISVVGDANESKEQLELKIYEKVLLQEAYSLELEKQDPIVSQRLLKQMEFILQSTQIFQEPTEEALYAYYKEHIGDYSEIESLDFKLLKLPSSKGSSVTAILKIIEIVPDAHFQGEKHFENVDKEMLIEQFGNYFTRELLRLREGSWSSILRSKGAFYLVYIEKRRVLSAYAFDLVEDRVYQDYKRSFMQDVKRKAYQAIRKNYTIEVE